MAWRSCSSRPQAAAGDGGSHPAGRAAAARKNTHTHTQTDCGTRAHEIINNNFGAPTKPVFPLAFTVNFSIAVFVRPLHLRAGGGGPGAPDLTSRQPNTAAKKGWPPCKRVKTSNSCFGHLHPFRCNLCAQSPKLSQPAAATSNHTAMPSMGTTAVALLLALAVAGGS